MPLPLIAVAAVAVPLLGGIGGKMKNTDTTTLMIGGLALWWVLNETKKVAKEAVDKANIVPESGEFLSGLFGGAEDEYYYYPDQSGSPNPPAQDWWDMASDLGATDAWKDRGAGPIRMADGSGIPTSPIIGVNRPSQAQRYGGNVRDFFTEGKLLKAIDPFPDWR
tara:strand:+ start:63 stop:557 length:495 start_codon:yes stop_codon:yes gene_type:complete